MIKNILITVFFIVVNIFSTQTAYSSKIKNRFIVTGHLYPIIDKEVELNKFIAKINSHKPEFVFILGDSNLQNKETVQKFKDSINAQLFFSPGNHELKKSKEKYLKNVGYFYKEIERENVKFILINSSDSIQNIKKNLKDLLQKNFNSGPVILLTHHRIWDDTLISAKPMQHDKSYYFEEIFPYLNKKVDFIFSGNSRRQYFRDLTDERSYGKQNINNILWLDKIGDIFAYSVGMGDGKPKANFTIVDVISNKELLVKGDYSSVENYEILPKNLIQKNRIKILDKYTKGDYLFIKKKKIYLLLISVAMLIIISLIVIRLKKNKQ